LTGVGGQIDFLRGAALGFDGLGKPILALNSTTKRGESKIVPFIKEGKDKYQMYPSCSYFDS
jgi:acyl-CoA hydrolase